MADEIPTAVIADADGDMPNAAQIDMETGECTLIFRSPDHAKFAVCFEKKLLPTLSKMIGFLISRWHGGHPEEGMFFRESAEVSVHSFNELRNKLAINFDGDICHVLPTETAEKTAALIEKQIERMETPAERANRMKRKHPTILTPNRAILKP